MPRISDDLKTHKIPGTYYGYSAAKLEHLTGALEYTLVTIVQDVSASVSDFKKEMEACLQKIVQACQFSPRADNLLIRLVEFNSQLNEIHGFKLLEDINLQDYDNVLNVCGMTALYDAAESSVLAAVDYAKQLSADDYTVNGIVVIITDGCDNASANKSGKPVKDALQKALKSEALESLTTILIGVGTKTDRTVSQFLQQFQIDADIRQYVEIDNADAKSLAKLAEFISKSISATSQSLGSGGPSQLISLNV